MNVGGRPSKLTLKLTREIAHLLSQGNFVETACDAVGIAKSTFYAWMELGELSENTEHVKFSDAIKRAVATAEIVSVGDVRDKVDNWQAQAWWLERRYPDRWGNRGKQIQEHVGKDGGPMQYEEVSLTDEQRANRIAAIFDRARARRDKATNGDQ